MADPSTNNPPLGEPVPRHSRLVHLEPSQALMLVQGSADLVLVFDSNRRVLEVRAGFGQSWPGSEKWPGALLDDLMCLASRPKLSLLLADNGVGAEEVPRWRHVNLQTGSVSFPVLLRYYGFSGPSGGTHLMIGRDLRPTVAMQDQVQRALIDLERKAEALRAPAPMHQQDAMPQDRIVEETARSLERRCVDAALRLSDGDQRAAARLLDMEEDEFERVLAGTETKSR